MEEYTGLTPLNKEALQENPNQAKIFQQSDNMSSVARLKLKE